MSNIVSRIRNRCLETLGKTDKPAPKDLVISPPFDFKKGPAMAFPGYSEDDISLLKEKALASAAMTSYTKDSPDTIPSPMLDGLEFDMALRPRSRVESGRFGLRTTVAYHARKVSRGVLA